MAGTITDKSGGITIARLKFGSTAKAAAPDIGMTKAEQQLSDIVDIGAGTKDRAQKTRKLDAFLRLFQSGLNYLNGTSSPKTLQLSQQSVEVEYVKIENPYLKKTDTLV